MSVHWFVCFRMGYSKYILSAPAGGEMMSISPVSPVNDNDAYVESQNELNSRNTLESMDETDFPRNALNRVFCCGGENDAKNQTRNIRGFMSAPGGAVQIITTSTTPDSGIDSISCHTVDDKVGDVNNIKNTGTFQNGSSTTASSDAPAEIVTEKRTRKTTGTGATKTLNLAISELNSTSTSTTDSTATITTATTNGAPSETSSSSPAGRMSPSKSYDDMIKFVFTEHGIRVISDREYVV